MITVVVVVVVVVVMNGSRRVASESESRLRRASKEIPEIAFARISERIPTKHSPKAELSFPGLSFRSRGGKDGGGGGEGIIPGGGGGGGGGDERKKSLGGVA